MSRPEPRPALKRAEDGTVHPAAPRVSPEQHLHPVPHAPAAATVPGEQPARAIEHDKPATEFSGKPVELAAAVPKDLRKAVRRRARQEGRTVDALVTEALARYVTD